MKRWPDFSFLVNLAPRSVLVSVGIVSLLTWLTVHCGISEEKVLEQYVKIQQHLADKPKNKIWSEVDKQLNQRIIENERLLKKKIILSTDKAIKAYEKQENAAITMTSLIVIKESQRLGGTKQLVLEQAIYYELNDGSMGIRGDWTKSWPNEIVTVEPRIRGAF